MATPKGATAQNQTSLINLNDFIGTKLDARMKKDEILDGTKIDFSNVEIQRVGLGRIAVLKNGEWSATIAILNDSPTDLKDAELVLRTYKQEDANGNPIVKCFFRKKQ
jgi:hypothetical protein